MKARYAILAKRVVTDAVTNVTSIIDILEEFQVQLEGDEPETGIIAVANEVSFAALFEADAGEELGRVPARFWIDTPRGTFLERNVELDFKGLPRARCEARMNVVPFAGEGIYTYNIESNGVLASWSVIGRGIPVTEAEKQPT